MTQQLIALAKSAMAAEEYAKAIERLEEAITENPENEAAIALLTEAKQKRRQQLTEHVNSLVSKSQTALAEKDYEAAISLLNSVLSLAKDDPYVAELAREHTVEIKLKQAQREKELEHRLQIARNAFAVGDYDEARHALARDFVDTRDSPEAEKLLRQIEDAWQLFDSARLAMNDKQYATARELLQELQVRFPQSRRDIREMHRRADYFLLVEKAEQARRQGALEAAYDYYKEALKNGPQDNTVRVALNELEETVLRKKRIEEMVLRAQSAMEMRKFDEAVHFYEKSLEYDSENQEVREGLKEAKEHAKQQRQEQIEKLLAVSEEAIQRQDLDFAHRRLDEAFRLIRLNPDSYQAQQAKQLLSEVENLQLRQEKLEPEIQELIAISQAALKHQDFTIARRNLEEANFMNSNHRQVKHLLAELTQAEQREAEIQELIIKSEAAVERQNFAQARQILRDASRLNPRHHQVEHLLLGLDALQREREAQEYLVLQAERAIKVGDFIEAQDLYNRVLFQNPDNVKAIEGLQKADQLLQNAEAERLVISAREHLRAADTEQTLRLLKRAEQIANSSDLKEQVSILTNNVNALIVKKAEVQRHVDEAKILLSLNQPDKALEITNGLLQTNPTDQAVNETHRQAFEAAAKKQKKATTRRPSPTQYILAVVFIVIFILSLLRILGVW